MIGRIDKIIASQGNYSRNDIKKLIKDGAVKLNGSVVLSPQEKADDEQCEITVHGKTLNFRRYIYIMLNKPKGVVSASRDSSQRTVIDLLPPVLRRPGLFPAGRLDSDTTGFVLITDDGELAHRLLAPKSHVDKTYFAVLAAPLDESTIRAFNDGARLSDGTICMSASVRKLTDDGLTAQVVLHEGKYHQVKRMFASCGNRVIELKRVDIGGVALDAELMEGESRELKAEEIAKLRQII